MKRFEEKYFMTLRHGGGPGQAGAGGVGGGGLQGLIEAKNREHEKPPKKSSPRVITHASIVNVNNVELSSLVDQGPKVQFKFPKSLQKIIDARQAVGKQNFT